MQTLLNTNTPPILYQFPSKKPPQIGIRVSNRVKPLSCSSIYGEIPAINAVSGAGAAVSTSDEGVRLKGKVDEEGIASVDAWITSKIPGITRARVRYGIQRGLITVTVNGRVVVDKDSYAVTTGDEVNCTIPKLQPLRVKAQNIRLDIKYEDEHVLVVNKPPHMVVHPAPGVTRGTLINALFYHFSLPNVTLGDSERQSEEEDLSDEDVKIHAVPKDQSRITKNSARPLLVHRLDKGTSGLLVVAKDNHSRAHLAQQFKSHTISRVYLSLTAGVPGHISDRVEIPIGPDLNKGIGQTAFPGVYHSGSMRHAASRYQVLEVLASGGAALEIGNRTYSSEYIGIPLLGDYLYGGTKDMALSLLRPRTPAYRHAHLIDLVSSIKRPCLHAMVLGFEHPCTGKYMHFSCPPPADFARVLTQLRSIST